MRLARLIEEKGSQILEGGPNYRNEIYNNYIKQKKNWTRGAPWAPTGAVPAISGYLSFLQGLNMFSSSLTTASKLKNN